MRQRMLGRGLEVTALGYGCMGLTQSYPPYLPRRESIAVIRKAIAMGVSFFDTAEACGPYSNESLLGEALQPYRKDVVIATKFGFDFANGQNDAHDRPVTLSSRPGRWRKKHGSSPLPAQKPSDALRRILALSTSRSPGRNWTTSASVWSG